MKVKLLMTLFIMLSLMVAGCVDDTWNYNNRRE